MRFLKNLVLLGIILVAIPLWLFEKVVQEMVGRPRLLTGTNPPGAAGVLSWAAKILTWLPGKTRKWLGKYVQAKHPRGYARMRKIFQ